MILSLMYSDCSGVRWGSVDWDDLGVCAGEKHAHIYLKNVIIYKL